MHRQRIKSKPDFLYKKLRFKFVMSLIAYTQHCSILFDWHLHLKTLLVKKLSGNFSETFYHQPIKVSCQSKYNKLRLSSRIQISFNLMHFQRHLRSMLFLKLSIRRIFTFTSKAPSIKFSLSPSFFTLKYAVWGEVKSFSLLLLFLWIFFPRMYVRLYDARFCR